jgi:integrase
MADGQPAPPPAPHAAPHAGPSRPSALAQIVGPREALPPIYRDLIERLGRETIPANTRRALEGDLRYLAAWRRLATGADLAFPESEDVVARFILDHSADLEGMAPDDPPRLTADALIDLGLRRSRAMPRATTLERRLASWRRLHGARNLDGPFGSPALRSLLARARAAARAVHGRAAKKSANPVDRDVLNRLVAARAPGLHGLRDAALIETAWASGGRRRSELAALRVEDLDRAAFATDGTIVIRLRETKTHKDAAPPPLLLAGRAAQALDLWLRASGVKAGPVFRALTRPDRLGRAKVLDRGLTGTAIRAAFARLVRGAGLPEGYASPHGLRSGFITEAARAGVAVEAVMRVTLHRSRDQVAAYYHELDLAKNPATRLRDGP